MSMSLATNFPITLKDNLTKVKDYFVNEIYNKNMKKYLCLLKSSCLKSENY